MNIGHIIPPVRPDAEGKSRKEALQDAANMIMKQIEALIPEADKQRWNRIRDERFELQLRVTAANGTEVHLPDELPLDNGLMLAKFFHRPLLLDVFSRNLKLPVQALQHLDTEHNPKQLADAIQQALNYLETNPHFLSYRFGYDEGSGMRNGLKELHDIARWAETKGYQVHVTPIRRYRRRGSEDEIVENKPGDIPAL
jgi:hypothetical protein